MNIELNRQNGYNYGTNERDYSETIELFHIFLTSYPHWVVDNVDKCTKFTYDNIGKHS